MNKLGQLIEAGETSIYELAEQLDIDVLEIAMAKNSIGYVHYDTICALADALECEVGDIYPALEQVSDFFDEEGISQDEMRDRMLSDEAATLLMSLGIDPDPARWFAIIKLKSGNEVRYKMSSVDMDGLKTSVENVADAEGYFVFHGDCRTMLLKKTSIREITIKAEAKYAKFSSIEDGNKLLLISTTAPRPEQIEVNPDEPHLGLEASPIANLVAKARNGEPIGMFFKMEDDDNDRYINLDEMEILEIPLGIMFPHLYEYGDTSLPSDEDADLEYMIPAGNA